MFSSRKDTALSLSSGFFINICIQFSINFVFKMLKISIVYIRDLSRATEYLVSK